MPLGSIEALLTRHGLPSGSLIIELTDADPRISLDELERRLGTLRRLGVRIALDGFGSGHAAITALRRLPVDVLKLDRSLVEGVVESARLHKITSGLLRIATDLGLQSVAEGVDLPEQVVALRAMGCTHGQGSAFSGPLDEYRLRRALASGHYPVPHGPAEPAFAGVAAGCTPVVLPLSWEAEAPSAHIMRLPSHPLDTWCVPGGGSVPCAPEFSYLESASAELVISGRTRNSQRPHPARSPRLPYGTRGFLLHRHRPCSA